MGRIKRGAPARAGLHDYFVVDPTTTPWRDIAGFDNPEEAMAEAARLARPGQVYMLSVVHPRGCRCPDAPHNRPLDRRERRRHERKQLRGWGQEWGTGQGQKAQGGSRMPPDMPDPAEAQAAIEALAIVRHAVEQPEFQERMANTFSVRREYVSGLVGPIRTTLKEATPMYVSARRCRQLRQRVNAPLALPPGAMLELPLRDVQPQHTFAWLAEDPLPVDPADPAARLRAVSWGVFWQRPRRRGPLGLGGRHTELSADGGPGYRPGALVWGWYGVLGELLDRHLPPATPAVWQRLACPYYQFWFPLDEPLDPKDLRPPKGNPPLSGQAHYDELALGRLFLALVEQAPRAQWVDPPASA